MQQRCQVGPTCSLDLAISRPWQTPLGVCSGDLGPGSVKRSQTRVGEGVSESRGNGNKEEFPQSGLGLT